MNEEKSNPYIGTPEGYLTACKQGLLDTDAINCAILRAHALVNLLNLQFSNGQDIERLSDQTIVNALWGIEGYLDQIKILTENQ
jgi:hypothetical protein